MGLAERRALADYQGKKFPQWVEEINKVVGFTLEFQVEWEGMGLEGYSGEFTEMFDYGFFFPLHKALVSICADNMGKDAFKGKVKKVRFAHNANGSYAECQFEGDTLVVLAQSGYVKSENWTDTSVKNLITYLEKNL